MKLNDLLERHDWHDEYDPRDDIKPATATIELSDVDDEGGEVEVELEFEYDIEPTEYEGNHVFNRGGADCTDVKITPFTFKKKRYTDIPHELVKYVMFDYAFETKHRDEVKKAEADKLTKAQAEQLMNQYYDYLFDQIDIDIPAHHYPDSR